MESTIRNADLAKLAEVLRDQQAAKLDVVAPASAIRAAGGNVWIDGTDERPDPERGVVECAGEFEPTAVCEEGLADKLRIPLPYLRRMRGERPDLFDANVNGWLHGVTAPGVEALYPADSRKFLARCFRRGDGPGVIRAFLSDGYGVIDHLDGLTAALGGIRDSGAEVEVVGCDLTDRRMYVRIAAPAIAALAPTLLAGYRDPFAGTDHQRGGWTLDRARAAAEAEGLGYKAGEEPIVFAGFELSNSETGGGAFTITPRIVVEVCRNGLKIEADAMRRVHLGSRLEAGLVRWSEDTKAKNLALITAEARDAVASFLDKEYVEAVVAGLEAKAGKQLDQPTETVQRVCKDLGFPPERTASVLDFFVRGGQTTAGGVMQAVTAAAQVIPDADLAAQVEGEALRALELAAR